MHSFVRLNNWHFIILAIQIKNKEIQTLFIIEQKLPRGTTLVAFLLREPYPSYVIARLRSFYGIARLRSKALTVVCQLPLFGNYHKNTVKFLKRPEKGRSCGKFVNILSIQS